MLLIYAVISQPATSRLKSASLLPCGSPAPRAAPYFAVDTPLGLYVLLGGQGPFYGGYFPDPTHEQHMIRIARFPTPPQASAAMWTFFRKEDVKMSPLRSSSLACGLMNTCLHWTVKSWGSGTVSGGDSADCWTEPYVSEGNTPSFHISEVATNNKFGAWEVVCLG